MSLVQLVLVGLIHSCLLVAAYQVGRIMGANATLEAAKKIGVQYAQDEMRRLRKEAS